MKNKNHLLAGAIFFNLVLYSNVSIALDAPAAPMMASPSEGALPDSQVLTAGGVVDVLEDKDTAYIQEKYDEMMQAKVDFGQAYKTKGKPSLAIFWNRNFNDRLSQWQAFARKTISAQGNVGINDKLAKHGDISKADVFKNTLSEGAAEAQAAYNRNVSGKQTGSVSGYTEVNVGNERRSGLAESVEFEFQSGFVRPFLTSAVEIVDRAAIMRLMERTQAKATDSLNGADAQKLETDALLGHVDFLAEIVFSESTKADLGMAFLVTVKEVKTGRIVAMFKNDGLRLVDPKFLAKTPKSEWIQTNNGFEKAKVKQHEDLRWVATKSGFKKVAIIPPEDEPTVPEQVGEQLAYHTMKELASVWGK